MCILSSCLEGTTVQILFLSYLALRNDFHMKIYYRTEIIDGRPDYIHIRIQSTVPIVV